jgi:hypothetical protein
MHCRIALAGVFAAALAVTGCTGRAPTSTSNPPVPSGAPPGSEAPATPGQAPVPPEDHPPGDIPDNQAFVAYRSAGGFQLKIPEGWARTDGPRSVNFTDRLNAVEVSWQPAATPPTVDRVKTLDVPELQRGRPAFTLGHVATVSLPGGAAVRIDAQENSAPNSVTGKQYRLDVQRFVFYRNGTQAVLALSSPVGADNVDPWKVVSESFRWG